MDTATTVAVFGFLGVVVTAFGGVVVAIYTNRAEKKAVAESAMEKVLQQRIMLRDETIAELKADNEECEEKLEVKTIQVRELQRLLRENGHDI